MSTEQFYALTPDAILAAVESAGFVTTGSLLQLNSYENRVYEIRLEKGLNPPELNERLIGKFYRPQRWSQAQLLEEHFFMEELSQNGLPAVAPLQLKGGSTLSSWEGIYFALFPKCLGRIPQELNSSQLVSVGRSLARLHNIGENGSFRSRLTLDVESFGWPALEILKPRLAPEVRGRYLEAAEVILEFLEDELPNFDFLRLHGDCHKGNLLLADRSDGSKEFFFVDFDDSVMGPAAQDLWMILSSLESAQEKEFLFNGYEELRQWDSSQDILFEPLRGLRIIHYAAWIARRWKDPSFPALFPDYGSYNYWAEETEALEKIAWGLRSSD